MDGENHGKPYFQMDDLGGCTIIFGNTHIVSTIEFSSWVNDGHSLFSDHLLV